MARYVAQRVVVLAAMLFGLVCITFAVSNIAPGDPAAVAAGPNATRDMVETMRREYGLDRPLPEQFVIYVSGLARGDLGRSISTTRPVMEELGKHLPNTIELVLAAMLLGVVGGISLGVLAAVRRDGWVDHVVRVFAVSGVALPMFWFGLLLQLWFAVRLDWLPPTGRLGVMGIRPDPITHLLIVDSLLRGMWATAWEATRHLILPAIVLAVPCLASIVRVARAEMIEALAQDFVLGQRANGLRPWRVVLRHALRSAMLPILALIGLRFGWMLGGSVLVETVFDWPGLGLLAVNAALLGDFKPVLGVTLVIGLCVMAANFLVDMAYAWLDPRLRQA
jgi:peptide/nickel transport system permease protein